MNLTTDDLIKIIVAILLPPLAVVLHVGCGAEFWIDLVLTFFFWIPGLIYALYIILKERV